jgi:cell wall-associated NlpC family hydrolase
VNGLGQQVVAEAARHAGAPYVYGASGPSTFDCSGFTMYVVGRLGRSLPHSSAAQYVVTPRISATAKQPGDLLFFFTGGSVTHVGIYAGGSYVWASPHSGDVVRLQPIYAAYAVGRVS